MTTTHTSQNISQGKKILLGAQFLFVAFGATVLVPLLTGLDPAVALLCAGVGTLIFHFVTGGVVPVYLGSSFAFIAPIVEGTKQFGLPGTLGGLLVAGFIYTGISALIKAKGLGFIQKLFPKVVIGPVIMGIGLGLTPNAVAMAKSDWTLAMLVLISAIVIVSFGKGMMKLMPILGAIIIGYTYSLVTGKVDTSIIAQAAWIKIPNFTLPTFDLTAIIYIAPVAIAPIIEHIGDMHAISGVAGKDFINKPGLNKTMLGNGFSVIFSSLAGGPPTTTYSEVTAAVSLTKITDPSVLRVSAVLAIVFAFVGKISAVLSSIPVAVLGGVMLLLFGLIAGVGIKTLIDHKVDLAQTRNQVIVSVILTMAIGGAVLNIGQFALGGIGLASVVGVILNLVLPYEEEEKKSLTANA